MSIVSTLRQDWVVEASGGVTTLVLFAWLLVVMLWGAFRVVLRWISGDVLISGSCP